MIFWPPARWSGGIGIESATRRSLTLSGGIVGPNETTLGDLRRFVAKLERWPDRAHVKKSSGAVLTIEFFENADPLTGAPDDHQ